MRTHTCTDMHTHARTLSTIHTSISVGNSAENPASPDFDKFMSPLYNKW
jgi:hypothetical protein